MSERVAVFDLDHTLLGSNSSFAFARYLLKERQLSHQVFALLTILYFFHSIQLISLKRLYLLSSRAVTGQLSQEILDRQAEQFVAFHLERLLLRPVAERLREAQKSGVKTVLLSGSPHFLVEAIARTLKIDCWAGTSEGNLFDGEAKLSWVKALAKGERFSLQEVVAYSDSWRDIPLLTAVGRAVVVNPGLRLRRLSVSRGWEQICSVRGMA